MHGSVKAVLADDDTIQVVGPLLWSYRLNQSIVAISLDIVERNMVGSVDVRAGNLRNGW